MSYEFRDAATFISGDAKFISLLASDSNGIPWVVFGGPDYVVHIRHPDGGYLRISWDGTITPRESPPEVSP